MENVTAKTLGIALDRFVVVVASVANGAIFCPATRHRNKIYKRKRKCKNEEEDQRDIHTPNEYVTSTCNLFCSRLNASIPPPFIPAIPVLRCNVRFCCEGSKKIRMAKQEDQDS